MATQSERLEAAIVKAQNASAIAEPWANGDETTEIQTASGPLPSIKKFMNDNAEVLGKSIYPLDSLKGLASAPQTDDRQYSVKGFYADTDVGGGLFYWDAIRDKADHNGGTIIDPDRIDAWDGTQGDLGTLFTVVSGSGCFVRVSYEEIEISWFGSGSDPTINVDVYDHVKGIARASLTPVAIRGEFHVNRSLVLANNMTINLYGEIIGDSSMTEPVVRYVGNYALIKGMNSNSRIVGNGTHGGHADETKNGVVNYGPPNLSTVSNVLFNKLINTNVSGNGAKWSAYNATDQDYSIDQEIGIVFFSSQSGPAGSGGTYLNSAESVDFRNLGTAVKFARVGQLNTVNNATFFRITWALFWFDGCNESFADSAICHTGQGVAGVRTTKTPSDPFKTNIPDGLGGVESNVIEIDTGGIEYKFPDRASSYNHVHGLMMEPGATAWNGRHTRFVQLAADGGVQNVIIGHGNTGHAYKDYNGKNTISTTGDWVFGESAVSPLFRVRGSDEAFYADKDHTDLGRKIVKSKRFSINNENVFLGRITSTDRQIAVFRITLLYGNAASSSGSRYNMTEMVLSVTRPLGSTPVLNILELKGTATTGASFVEPLVDGNYVKFGVQSTEVRAILCHVEELNHRLTAPLDKNTVEFFETPEVSTQSVIVASGLHKFGIIPAPITDNGVSLGNAGFRWSEVFAGNGTVNTSDERQKNTISDIPIEVLEAWSNISFKQYKMNHAVELKGDGARWHFGVIAQQIKQAFEDKGLNPFSYGLLCFNEWEENGETKSSYGVRYEECLALECAYLRAKLNGDL